MTERYPSTTTALSGRAFAAWLALALVSWLAVVLAAPAAWAQDAAQGRAAAGQEETGEGREGAAAADDGGRAGGTVLDAGDGARAARRGDGRGDGHGEGRGNGVPSTGSGPGNGLGAEADGSGGAQWAGRDVAGDGGESGAGAGAGPGSDSGAGAELDGGVAVGAAGVVGAGGDAAVGDAGGDGGIGNRGEAAGNGGGNGEESKGGVRTDLVRAILGLLALMTLALAAGHPKVRSFERRAGLAMVAATGMPFLALGAIARHPSVGILSDAVMEDLRPLLEFGLGWIGFRVGSEFDVRALDRLSRGVGRLVGMESFAAFLAAGLGSLGALEALAPGTPWPEVVRDALVLGACAAVSAPSGARALEAAGVLDERASRLVRKVAVLDDVVPIVVLALVAAFFRTFGNVVWVMPRLGWVFVQVGMGAALGTLALALMRAARSPAEEIAVTFGSVAFTAGMAGYLNFSPLTVGCIAGVVVVNVEGGARAAAFSHQLQELERPIYMVFFAIAGALWDVREWRGWVIVLPFVLARMLGKLSGARAAYVAEHRDVERTRKSHAAIAEVAGVADAEASRNSWLPVAELPDARTLGVALLPTSAVSVAVIISAQQAYPRHGGPELVTVVIVGAIVSEIVFQLRVPSMKREMPAPTSPSHAPRGGMDATTPVPGEGAGDDGGPGP